MSDYVSAAKTVKKARKNHVCDYCGQQINAGEPYERWKGFNDGWYTCRMHQECYDDCREWGFEWLNRSEDRPEREKSEQTAS